MHSSREPPWARHGVALRSRRSRHVSPRHHGPHGHLMRIQTPRRAQRWLVLGPEPRRPDQWATQHGLNFLMTMMPAVSQVALSPGGAVPMSHISLSTPARSLGTWASRGAYPPKIHYNRRVAPAVGLIIINFTATVVWPSGHVAVNLHGPPAPSCI